MIDYMSDVETIMDDFKVIATHKRPSQSYNNKGISTTTYETQTTAYVDIQAIDVKHASFIVEEGKVEVYSHKIYACYDIGGTILSVLKGDRFYVGDDFYEVEQVIEYDSSHLELYANLVKGKV